MKRLLILLFASIFMIFGCTKDAPIPTPKAEFTFTVGLNGEVSFNNLSTDANTYKWEFGDQYTSTEKYPNHFYTTNGSFQVSLTASSSGGSDVIVKTIQVNTIKGNLLVYKAANFINSEPISVWVDEVYKGFINGAYYYNSSPSCGNVNSVTAMDLTPGTHALRCQDLKGTLKWSSTVNIVGGKCNTVGLN